MNHNKSRSITKTKSNQKSTAKPLVKFAQSTRKSPNTRRELSRSKSKSPLPKENQNKYRSPNTTKGVHPPFTKSTTHKKQFAKSENKGEMQKQIINKKIEECFDQMKNGQMIKSLKWKRTFIDLMKKEKAIDLSLVTNRALIPKSMNHAGSVMFLNYKFWVIYTEYISKYLNLSSVIEVISYAVSNMENKNEIRNLHKFFHSMILTLRISKWEIEKYIAEHHLKVNKKNKFYEYLLCKNDLPLNAGNILEQKDANDKINKVVEDKDKVLQIKLDDNKGTFGNPIIITDSPKKTETNPPAQETPKMAPKEYLPISVTHESELKRQIENKAIPIIKVFDEAGLDEDIELATKILNNKDEQYTQIISPIKNEEPQKTPEIKLNPQLELEPKIDSPKTPQNLNLSSYEEDDPNDLSNDSFYKYLKLKAQMNNGNENVKEFKYSPSGKKAAKFVEYICKTVSPKENGMNESEIIYPTFKFNCK